MFHEPGDAPDDADLTVGFISTAVRVHGSGASADGRLSEPDAYTVVASASASESESESESAETEAADVWDATVEPTVRPTTSQPTARPTLQPTTASPTLGLSAADMDVMVPGPWRGAGATVFVLDTGCAAELDPEDGGSFSSDAERRHASASGDSHGHGTFVASVVRRAAPDARVVCMRVLDETGAGTVSAAALALATVAEMCPVSASARCVVNLSFRAPAGSKVLERAVQRLVHKHNIAVVGAYAPRSKGFPAESRHALLARPCGAALADARIAAAAVCAPGTNVVGGAPGRLEVMSGASVSAAWVSAVVAQTFGAEQEVASASRVMQHVRAVAKTLGGVDQMVRFPSAEHRSIALTAPEVRIASGAPTRADRGETARQPRLCADLKHPNACLRFAGECGWAAGVCAGVAEAAELQQQRRRLADTQIAAQPFRVTRERPKHPRIYTGRP